MGASESESLAGPIQDPEYREALLAFDHGDDSEYAHYEALEAAEIMAEDLEYARFEVERPGA